MGRLEKCYVILRPEGPKNLLLRQSADGDLVVHDTRIAIKVGGVSA